MKFATLFCPPSSCFIDGTRVRPPPPPERNGDGMMMMICATALASPLLALSARVSLTLRYLFLHSILSRHLTHTPTFGLASIFSVFFDLGL